MLKQWIRTWKRAGWNSDVWPVALLVFAVLVPAVCLLWFMSQAMRNERLAARQKLADAYRGQLSSTRERLNFEWKETAVRLESIARSTSAPLAFARCVEEAGADSVLIFDQHGKQLYPNWPARFENGFNESDPQWLEASRLEHLRKDFRGAAQLYNAVARRTTNIHAAGRAAQAQARCLVQAKDHNAAVRVIDDMLSTNQHAVDPQGRLIVANAELMALELLTNRSSPEFREIAERLAGRLRRYDNEALAASQRRFLMHELQRLLPEMQFPTLPAEELAAEFNRGSPAPTADSVLHRTGLSDTWSLTTPARRVVALFRTENLIARLRSGMGKTAPSADAAMEILPPGADDNAAFVTISMGESFPGWRLALLLRDRMFDDAARHGMAVYLWTGVLVIAAMGVLALLAVRVLRRQTALARLKNDLAATVSHELRTPLSSMRVLVDTLLNAKRFDEHTTRAYLELIAQENERLSRVIENFLTFSRMERKKHAFHFAPVSAREMVDAAVAAVRERFNASGARLDVRVETDVPEISADREALTTALINLLDNAGKYSEDDKRIELRAHAEAEMAVFTVSDHGIGIAASDVSHLFQPFQQVDSRLSRRGSGCGLGLSIVHYIVAAHGGTVSVESEPGRGSTFSISIPARRPVACVKEEAVA